MTQPMNVNSFGIAFGKIFASTTCQSFTHAHFREFNLCLCWLEKKSISFCPESVIDVHCSVSSSVRNRDLSELESNSVFMFLLLLRQARNSTILRTKHNMRYSHAYGSRVLRTRSSARTLKS